MRSSLAFAVENAGVTEQDTQSGKNQTLATSAHGVNQLQPCPDQLVNRRDLRSKERRNTGDSGYGSGFHQ